MKSALLFSLFFFGTTAAQAQDTSPSNSVFLDFASKSVTAYGVYKPTSAQQKRGTDAEIEARQHGLAAITPAFQKACPATAKVTPARRAIFDVHPEWLQQFRSHGSEIFPKGILRIKLVAPANKLFSKFNSTHSNLSQKNSDSKLTFSIPLIPVGLTLCGAIPLKIGAISGWIAPHIEKKESAKSLRLVIRNQTLTLFNTPDETKISNELLDSLRQSSAENPAALAVFGSAQ